MVTSFQTLCDLEQISDSNKQYLQIEQLNSYLVSKNLPIQIQQDKIDTEGRYIKAVDNIVPEQIIFSEEPLSGIIFDQFKKRICSFCFLSKIITELSQDMISLCIDSNNLNESKEKGPASKVKKRQLKPGAGGFKKGLRPPPPKPQTLESELILQLHCTGCGQVYFCSEECKIKFMQSDSNLPHEQICRAYRRLATSKSSRHSKSVLKLVINLIQKYNLQKIKARTITNISALNRIDEIKLLQTHINQWSVEDKQNWNKGLSLILNASSECKLKIPGVNESAQKKWLLGLVSVIESNSFGLFSQKNQLVGRALLPLGSFFNHSCSPNVEVKQKANVLQFQALTFINIGESITISYIDESSSYNTRQSHLISDYHFCCLCPKCSSEKN